MSSSSSPGLLPRPVGWRPPGPPANEIPGLVVPPTMLGRGPDAALFLKGVAAYSTGVELLIGLSLRRRFDESRRSIHALLAGMPMADPEVDPAGRFMLGAQFSDGRRGVMSSGFASPDDSGQSLAPGVVSLLSSPGGWMGDLHAEGRFWLRPLPPPGPLLIVLRWDELGMSETTVELDGSAIAAAGADSVLLWPPVPLEDRLPPSPPPLPPPSSGWFAPNR